MRLTSFAPLLFLASACAQVTTIENEDGRSVVVSIYTDNGALTTSAIYSLGPEPWEESKTLPEKTSEPTDIDAGVTAPTRTVHAQPHRATVPSNSVTAVPKSGTIMDGAELKSFVSSGDAAQKTASESGKSSGRARVVAPLAAVIAAAAGAALVF